MRFKYVIGVFNDFDSIVNGKKIFIFSLITELCKAQLKWCKLENR